MLQSGRLLVADAAYSSRDETFRVRARFNAHALRTFSLFLSFSLPPSPFPSLLFFFYASSLPTDDRCPPTSLRPSVAFALSCIANRIPSFCSFFLQGGGGSGGAAGGLKFTVADTCDRIKEEFSFIQSQYHT